MSVVYITADQITELHRQAIEQFGGLDGLRSEHSLLSAVFQSQQSAFGQDAYPTIPDKAAAYGFFIAEGQAFLDGNKRTAAAAMLVFLDLNGWELSVDDDEIALMFEGLATRQIDQLAFFDWVSGSAAPVQAFGVHA